MMGVLVDYQRLFTRVKSEHLLPIAILLCNSSIIHMIEGCVYPSNIYIHSYLKPKYKN